MSKIGNGIIRSIPFTPDCQNKWDLDGPIIGISSRGYNREEKSFYVGYYFMGMTPDSTHDVFNYLNEARHTIIEDELFDTDFRRLKQRVKQWYKDHFIEALEKALKMAREDPNPDWDIYEKASDLYDAVNKPADQELVDKYKKFYGFEALERITNHIDQFDSDKYIADKKFSNDYITIEKELEEGQKAKKILEIIKDKKVDYYQDIIESWSYEEYLDNFTYQQSIGNWKEKELLTEEEYGLLKEVL